MKKVTLTIGPVLKLFIMLLLLLRDVLFVQKGGSLLGFIGLLQYTEHLQLGAKDAKKMTN